MEFTYLLDNRPLWAMLISLIAAVMILFAEKQPYLREGVTLTAAVGKMAIVFSMIPLVLAGIIPETAPIHIAEGVSLHFRADPAGMIFAALASFLWVITSVYSIGYLKRISATNKTGYYFYFAVCLSAAVGIAFSANLLTLFIFYEILAIATYPLVIHHRSDDAVWAGRKYLVYALVSGQLLLLAIVGIHVLGEDGTFTPGGSISENIPNFSVQIIFLLLILGAAVKAGLMPLHGWLPTAMVAPSPVSALLHAVAVVNAGVFAIIRIVGYIFGPGLLLETGANVILAWVAAFTIIASSLIALGHDNLKKRLAYSTVGQLSYMVLGAALLSGKGLLGGLFYMVAHSFMKITLFLCAGGIYATNGISNVSEMKGLGRKMPRTMTAFALCALGISGLPAIVGFIGKWNIAMGAFEAGMGIFIAVIIGSALLSLGYLMPVVYIAFFKKPFGKTENCEETGNTMLVPLLLTAGISVALGIFPDFGAGFYSLARLASESIVGGVN